MIFHLFYHVVLFSFGEITSINGRLPKESDARNIFEAMYIALQRAKKAPQIQERASVCYPHVGCFSYQDSLMKRQTRLNPKSPEKIGIRFYVFNNKKPTIAQEIPFNDQQAADIVPKLLPIAVVAHGFNNSYQTKELALIKDSLLRLFPNVIMPDWSGGAKFPHYWQSATNSELVGRLLGVFISHLVEWRQIDPSKFYIVGFSLGAQIAGFAGKWMQKKYSMKLGRISALDPAGPFFEGYPWSYVTKNDALFVDVIHSSYQRGNFDTFLGKAGMKTPVGHVDFYPNGGRVQPRCRKHLTDITCTHYCAVIYYEASLSAFHRCAQVSFSCKSWDDYLKGNCKTKDQQMGFFSRWRPGRGTYYHETLEEYPFCTVKRT